MKIIEDPRFRHTLIALGLTYSLIVIFLLLILFVPKWFFGSLPDYIPSETLSVTLPYMIQVEGIILGLGGVMLANHLNSINERLATLSDQLTDLTDESSSLKYQRILITINVIKNQRKLFIINTGIVILLFTTSIFTTLQAISNIPKPGQTFGNSILYVPIATMIGGIFCMLLVISTSGIQLSHETLNRGLDQR